jgi:hypothetical protein
LHAFAGIVYLPKANEDTRQRLSSRINAPGPRKSIRLKGAEIRSYLARRPLLNLRKEHCDMWRSLSYYGALAVESLLGVFGIRLYEEPRYEVIERIGDRVDIRRYAPRLAAEVDLVSPGEAGRSEAFQLLFAYIAGANRAPASGKDNIAMTMPVEVAGMERLAMTVPVQTSEAAGARHMRFFLPAKYRSDTAPKPENSRVRLVIAPEDTIATLRFSGSGGDGDLRKRRAELIARLAAAKWRPKGEPYTLFYDAPFTLPFLRRNEVAVAVVKAG